jgi:serine/threonine protein kinase
MYDDLVENSDRDGTLERRVAVKAFVVDLQAKDPKEDSKDDSAEKQRLGEIARRRVSFEAERSILAQIEHPHIVKMHECFEEKGCLYIVLELCHGGELYERIAQRVMSQGGRGFEEKVARHLFRQMLYAVSYLHANRIVHRDIKTENFLLLGQVGSDDADVLKLCDFGTAIRLSAQRPRSNGRVGTLSYMAPEVYANRGADVCADVWSLGVVLYLILVGANPFRNSQTKTKVATVRKIETGDFDQTRFGWLDLSEDARKLIKSLLVLEEEKRLTCVESLRHHWVQAQEGGLRNEMPRSAALPTPRAGVDQDPAAHASSVLVLLMRYASLDPMQKVVLAACSQTVSEKYLSTRPLPIPWYSLFVTLDEDGDGRIGFEEFATGMKALLGSQQVPNEKLHSLARALDTDGSGAIEWGEWLSVGLLTVDDLADAVEPLGTAFRLLDRPTGDGKVGAADLLAVVDGGTAGGEFRVPADVAREQILAAISQYSPKPENGTPVTGIASIAPPSLVETDIRKVLQSLSTR